MNSLKEEYLTSEAREEGKIIYLSMKNSRRRNKLIAAIESRLQQLPSQIKN